MSEQQMPPIWWDGADFIYIKPGALLGMPGHEFGPELYRAQKESDLPADARRLVPAPDTEAPSADRFPPGTRVSTKFGTKHYGTVVGPVEWEVRFDKLVTTNYVRTENLIALVDATLPDAPAHHRQPGESYKAYSKRAEGLLDAAGCLNTPCREYWNVDRLGADLAARDTK